MNCFHRNKPLPILAGVLAFAIATSTEAGTVSINLESTPGTAPFTTRSAVLEGDWRRGDIYWEPLGPGETASNLAYGDPAENPRTAVGVTHSHTGAGAPYRFSSRIESPVQKIGLMESQVELTNLPPDRFFEIVIYVIPNRDVMTFTVNGRTVRSRRKTVVFEGDGDADYPGLYDPETVIVKGINSGPGGTITIRTGSANAHICGIQCQGVLQGESVPQVWCYASLKKDFTWVGLNRNPCRAALKLKRGRSGTFYTACLSGGDDFDRFFYGGAWNSKKLRVRINPIKSTENITAEVRRFDYPFFLSPEEWPRDYERLKVTVKPKRRIRKAAREEIRFTAVSSTRDPEKMDSASGIVFEKGR